jgi:hypothetical protein
MATERSLMNRLMLSLVMWPKTIYRKLGVNTDHLYTILDIKLSLDDRRPNPLQRRKEEEEEENTNKSLLVGGMMFLMGGLFILPTILINNPVTAMTGYYGMLMFFLAATLISDFTSVLIDVRDNAIILPRPINDRTFMMSRLLHIIVYIGKMVLPLSIAGFVTVGIRYGINGILWHALLLPLVVLFTIFLVNAAYLVILKISTPEKFKSIITSFQVVFAILIYASYQLLPRMIDRAILESYTLPEKWWALLIPPAWFAHAFGALLNLEGTTFQWLSAALSLIMPIGCLWLIVRVFAPSFNRKLGLIAGSGSESGTAVANKVHKQHWSDKLASWLTRSKAEEMGFAFTWKLTGRLRDFKLKTYPSLGYMFVLVIIIAIPRKNFSMDEALQNIAQSRGTMLSMIYFIGVLMLQTLAFGRYTESDKAAWIFFSNPVQHPGDIITGYIKALLAKFLFPFMIVVGIVLLALVGWKALPEVVLGTVNIMNMAFINTLILGKYMPFSRPVAEQQKGGNILYNILVIFVLGLMVALHYVLKFLPFYATWILTGLSLALALLLYNKIRKLEWPAIQK